MPGQSMQLADAMDRARFLAEAEEDAMNRECECWHHRYGIVHCLPGDERVYDHSQGTWDATLRGREDVESYPSVIYRHGMTATELRREAADLERRREAAVEEAHQEHVLWPEMDLEVPE